LSPIDGGLVGQTEEGFSAPMAVLAVVWLVRIGHEGAEIVWTTTADDLFG
jgi:hypothetical protein